MRRLSGIALGLGLVLSACSEDEAVPPVQNDTSADTDTTGEDADTGHPDVDDTSEPGSDVIPDTDTPAPEDDGCDPLDLGECILPFPSNRYLTPDASRVTGYTLDFGQTLPVNEFGARISPEPYRRLDGYGVGVPILVSFPHLDLTGLATEHNTEPSLAADAPIVLFEVTREGQLERIPYFVDQDTRETDLAKRLLIVRPGVLLREGARYVVAFRGLKNLEGTTFEGSEAFRQLRDGAVTDPRLTARQARFEAMFDELSAAGIERATLQLAWDFNTASHEALHGPLLHMMEDAFAKVGETGGTLSELAVQEFSLEEHANWAFVIRGNLTVPHYMRKTSTPNGENSGYVFNRPDDAHTAMPEQNGDIAMPLWIYVPRSALPQGEGVQGEPHRLVMYGHGQNGLGSQVGGGFNGRIANAHKLIFFATDLSGMSEHDIASIFHIMTDMNYFPWLADRLHQGLLNHALLARAMKVQLPGLEALTERGVQVEDGDVMYSGISQGGIYGVPIVALSPDVKRGHLGVPGNNYSYLLGRSKNFNIFELLLNPAYKTRNQVLLTLQVVQNLWDSADPVSWFRHIHTSPVLGQEEKSILLAPAKGDPQVPVSSNEWVVRSRIGIPVLEHYDHTRSITNAEEVSYPHQGSGLVLYDFGNEWPAESVNVPPAEGYDPHSDGRSNVKHNAQMVHFLKTGEIIDVCSDDGVPGCRPN